MIDLEYPHLRMWVAVGEGIQPGTENHHLSGGRGHRVGDGVLGEARTGGQEQSTSAADVGVVFLARLQLGQLLRRDAGDSNGQWIGEDARLTCDLVVGASIGGGEGGPTWLT